MGLGLGFSGQKKGGKITKKIRRIIKKVVSFIFDTTDKKFDQINENWDG